MDLWRGTLTVRRAATLAAYLPAGAQVYGSEGSDMAWTQAEHMLSEISHLLNGANWQRAGSKGSPPDAPKTPSDAAADEAKALATLEKARRYKERKAAREAAQTQ